MRRQLLPYRAAAPSSVSVEPWSLNTPDGEIPVPEYFEGWDYNTQIHLRRRATVDVDGIRAQTGLPLDAALALTTVWSASGSNLTGPGQCHALPESGSVSLNLDLKLDSTSLGGVLTVSTQAVLTRSRPAGLIGSPRRAGSILWVDLLSLRLQGDDSQFPMAIVDFANTSYPDSAGWFLQIDRNLDASAMGSMLLLVNERIPIIERAFRNASKPREVDFAVLSAVRADVTRQLIEHALNLHEFQDGVAFDEETLGAVLLDVFQTAFPGESIAAVKARRVNDANYFSTDVQSTALPFGGLT